MAIFPQFLRRLRFKHGHGVHSPFVYQLITNTINVQENYYFYDKIRSIAEGLKSNNHKIAYSVHGEQTKRKPVAHISQAFCSNKKAELLFRLAKERGANRQLHIGSSFGLDSVALSGFSRNCTIDIVEENPEILPITQKNISAILPAHTHFFTDLPSDSLQTLSKEQPYDLIYISRLNELQDATWLTDKIHTALKTDGVLIIDGIHANKQGKKLWELLCKNPDFTISIDLYHLGLLYFMPLMNKKNYNAYI